MALTKTQAEMLRYVFGYKETVSAYGLISQPKEMVIVKGSNQWKCAVELAQLGLVVITQPTRLNNSARFCYFVQRAIVPVPNDFTVYTGLPEKADFLHD